MTKKYEYKELNEGLEEQIIKFVCDFRDNEEVGQTTAAFMISQSVIYNFYKLLTNKPNYTAEQQEKFNKIFYETLQMNELLYKTFLNALDPELREEHMEGYAQNLTLDQEEK